MPGTRLSVAARISVVPTGTLTVLAFPEKLTKVTSTMRTPIIVWSAIAQPVQPDQRGILQQHNGLAVLDRAGPDHLQGRGQRQLEYLDIFALRGIATARGHAVLRCDLILKPVSSSASRRMQVCASSPSSNPAQASTRRPSMHPFINAGKRNWRIKTTVERSTLNNNRTAPLPRS